MKSILFVDKYNNLLSQIVEAYARKFFSDKYQSYSGGIEERDIDPVLVKILKEDGINISEHYSKLAYMFGDISFDYVLILTEEAKNELVLVPESKKVIQEKFSEEVVIAQDEAQRIEYYRELREQLKNWVRKRLA